MRTQIRVALLIWGVVTLALPLAAQTVGNGPEPLPGKPAYEIFQAPLASLTEPASVLRYAGDSQMDFGLAQPFALYTLEGKGSAWQVGLRPGILTRFEVRDAQLVLKAADFRLGLPLAFRKGKWSARVELFHSSSHRGADFVSAHPAPSFTYSREAVQALVAYDMAGHWRIYAGPTVVLRSHPGVGRASLQAGAEWFPQAVSRPRARFYLAGDFETRQEVGWHSNLSVQPGVLFVTRRGEPVGRLAGCFYRGQLPFGQFFRERETRVGVQLVVELRHTIKSLVTRTR